MGMLAGGAQPCKLRPNRHVNAMGSSLSLLTISAQHMWGRRGSPAPYNHSPELSGTTGMVTGTSLSM
eukprot:scaffold320018_cov32-Tisochrysis_lutea.AAC.5